MEKQTELQLYADILIIGETIVKSADGSIVSSIINGITSYVKDHIDNDNKVGSVIAMLAPGAIEVMLGGLSGLIFGTLASMFHINIANAIKSIVDTLTPHIESKTVTSEHIESATQNAIQQAITPLTEEEQKTLEKSSFDKSIQDARFVKLAVIAYDNNLLKEASFFNTVLGKSMNFLTKIISTVFKVVLASAGFMVAGDIANSLIGRPSVISGTEKGGKSTEQTESEVISKQTKFPLKKSYSPENKNTDNDWIENISNNKSSIEQMLFSFAKDVYDGLDDKEQIVLSSPAFQTVVERIIWLNHSSPGAPMVYIPSYLHSKKQIVDFFIDDVANRA